MENEAAPKRVTRIQTLPEALKTISVTKRIANTSFPMSTKIIKELVAIKKVSTNRSYERSCDRQELN